MDIGTAKSELKALRGTIERAFNLTKEEDGEAFPEVVQSLESIKDNLMTTLEMAETLIDTDKQATLCGVATAILQAFGDETRYTSDAVGSLRARTFGNGDFDMFKYIEKLLEGVEHVALEWGCPRCGQTYLVYAPVASGTSYADAVAYLKANKQKLRQYNSKAAMEMIYFSGLCEACWQETTK